MRLEIKLFIEGHQPAVGGLLMLLAHGYQLGWPPNFVIQTANFLERGFWTEMTSRYETISVGKNSLRFVMAQNWNDSALWEPSLVYRIPPQCERIYIYREGLETWKINRTKEKDATLWKNVQKKTLFVYCKDRQLNLFIKGSASPNI